jgi:hypothetical protein
MSVKHLWEYNHPYSCSDTNYYVSGYENPPHGLFEYDSWESFAIEWGNSDPDLNLIFRWDWKKDVDGYNEDQLWLFFILQRKGNYCPCKIVIRDEDEPAVRDWLRERIKTIKAVWEPIE